MASFKVPYLVVKPGRAGVPRYFWQPAKALRDAGWQPQRVPDNWQELASDPRKLEAAAIDKAKALNEELAAWRDGAPTPAIEKGTATRTEFTPGTLGALIALYKASPRWIDPADRNALSKNSKRTYAQNLDILQRWAGTTPARAITPKMVQDLYDRLWRRSPSVANAVITMLRILLGFGRREGWVTVNAATAPDMTGLPPSGKIWPPDAIKLFVSVADLIGRQSIGTAILVNEWLGQRESDVLHLRRSLLRNGQLMLRQEKTGAGVLLPIGMVESLSTRIAEEIARQDKRWGVPIDADKRCLIISEATGEPWNGHTFRHEFAEIRAICAKLCSSFEVDYLTADGDAVVRTAELQFMHLRHTAVVRNAEASVPDTLISAITGHTLASVKRILERYLVRTGEMARQAFAMRLAKEHADG